MRKTLSFVVAMLLILSVLASPAAFADSGLSLRLGEKTVLAESTALSAEAFHENGIYITDEKGKIHILDPDGVENISRQFDHVGPIGDSALMVRDNSNPPNVFRLVQSDGTYLIRDWFCLFQELGDRYLEIIFANGPVSDKDKAYVYISAEGDAYLTSGSTGEKMYSGYAMIFDLERGIFIDDLRNEDKNTVFTQVGDTLLMEASDGKQILYDTDGNKVKTPGRLRAFGDYFLLEHGEGLNKNYSLLDPQLQELAELPFLPSAVLGENAFVLYDYAGADEGQYCVLDSAGDPLVDQRFKTYPERSGNYFYAQNMDGNYLVYDLECKAYLRAEDAVCSVIDQGHGYLKLRDDNGEEKLLCPDGAILKLEAPVEKLCSAVVEGGETRLLVLEEGEYSLTVQGTAKPLADFLVAVDIGDSKSLYSTLDGALLLEGYQDYGYSLGRVYALNGDGWVSYALDLEQTEVTPQPPAEPTPVPTSTPTPTSTPAPAAEIEPEPGEVQSEGLSTISLVLIIAGAVLLIALVTAAVLLLRKRKAGSGRGTSLSKGAEEPWRSEPVKIPPYNINDPGPGTEKLSSDGGADEADRAQAKLLVMSGALQGAEIPMKDGESLSLGRDARRCHLVFDGTEYPNVDDVHCEILFEASLQSFTVRDLSSHGTLVEGTRLPVQQNVTVGRGVTVCLGSEDCVVRLE